MKPAPTPKIFARFDGPDVMTIECSDGNLRSIIATVRDAYICPEHGLTMAEWASTIVIAVNSQAALEDALKEQAKSIMRHIENKAALLEALKILLIDFAEFRRDYEPNPMKLHRPSVEQARAAIAAAEKK